jgi:hypothetical protein
MEQPQRRVAFARGSAWHSRDYYVILVGVTVSSSVEVSGREGYFDGTEVSRRKWPISSAASATTGRRFVPARTARRF